MASRISSRALAVSRQCFVRSVRFESTTSQATQGAKEAAQKAGNVAGESAAKAKEAATTAASKASSAATAVAQRAQSALGPQLGRLQCEYKSEARNRDLIIQPFSNLLSTTQN